MDLLVSALLICNKIAISALQMRKDAYLCADEIGINESLYSNIKWRHSLGHINTWWIIYMLL